VHLALTAAAQNEQAAWLFEKHDDFARALTLFEDLPEDLRDRSLAASLHEQHDRIGQLHGAVAPAVQLGRTGRLAPNVDCSPDEHLPGDSRRTAKHQEHPDSHRRKELHEGALIQEPHLKSIVNRAKNGDAKNGDDGAAPLSTKEKNSALLFFLIGIAV